MADGYGGTLKFTLTVPIEPNPIVNHTPTNGQGTVTSSSSAIGTVTGTVSADDEDGDPLTYTLKTGPSSGVVKLDPTTGVFTYTPNVDARYTALVTPGVDTDTFTVTVSDGVGGTMTDDRQRRDRAAVGGRRGSAPDERGHPRARSCCSPHRPTSIAPWICCRPMGSTRSAS